MDVDAATITQAEEDQRARERLLRTQHAAAISDQRTGMSRPAAAPLNERLRQIGRQRWRLRQSGTNTSERLTVHRFDGHTIYRLHSIPRPARHNAGAHADAGDRAGGAHRPHLFASLAALHASVSTHPDGEFVTAWVRPPAQSLQVLVGAAPMFLPTGPPTTGTGLRRVLYPPGAQAAPGIDTDSVLGQFAHWVPCVGRPDALWAPTRTHGRDGDITRGSFDDLVAHLPQPFAWLVLARPRSEHDLAEELTAINSRLPRMRARTASEADRVEIERDESRYRELDRARSTGSWHVRVLVGALDEVGARTAATLLCNASELTGQPYALLPGPRSTSLHDAVGGERQHHGSAAPFVATTELLSVLARTPATELPGLRLETPQTFDLTPETERGELHVGSILDAGYAPSGMFAVSRDTLNRHTFVCGATGSGKSQTVRALLEGAARATDPIPWLVIEPAKAEYARMAGRLAGHATVTVIRPGDLDVAPASLNPLEPEPGFPLQSHADLVRALFLAAFEAHEPFPQVLSTALTTVYTRAGWDLVTGEPHPEHRPRLRLDDPRRPAGRRYPNLTDLQAAARDTVESVGYGSEVTADVRGFVDVRIGSLRQGAPGRFFEGGHPLDIGRLLSGNVVLELDAITNDQDKAFLMGAVLIRIVEHLRLHRPGSATPLRHLTVIEEAHRLLRNATDGASAAAVELFAALLAEIRAYGEGIVVVEQIPTKILPDVIKNTALKIVHRLPAADDRAAVGGTMNLQPDQSELVVALRPGTAAVSADGMDRPVLIGVELGEDREDGAVCRTAPPIAGPRSQLCADACAAVPCTLRGLNTAGHLAADPLLLVWVDAVATAHLAGATPPPPAPDVVETVAEADARAIRCALALAVERAVRARRDHLRSYVDPEDLESRVLTAVLALLAGDDPGPAEPLRWTAGRFRWLDVRSALEEAIRDGRTGPHPRTAEWAVRGLRLDGPDPESQLDRLARHRGPATGTATACVGDPAASGLVTAVHELTGGWSPTHAAVAIEGACAADVTDLTTHLLDALFPMEDQP